MARSDPHRVSADRLRPFRRKDNIIEHHRPWMPLRLLFAHGWPDYPAPAQKLDEVPRDTSADPDLSPEDPPNPLDLGIGDAAVAI